jgi:phosphoserine phosphatase RsbU/P
MSRDLKAAAKIQATFLPREIPNVAGADFAWIYQPCDELAGDGLSIIPLGDGKVGLYILDVSGHGVASALLSVTLCRLLSPPGEPSSILMGDGDTRDRRDVTPPALIAARLNRLFPFDASTEQFATMVYGILNVATGEFRYVSAGHPGPVHLPGGGDPVILESQGFPIGVADDAFEERSVRLGAGDRLYLYSDGVSEAMDPARKQFGDARLLETIGQSRSEPLQASVATLLGEIGRWHGSRSFQEAGEEGRAGLAAPSFIRMRSIPRLGWSVSRPHLSPRLLVACYPPCRRAEDWGPSSDRISTRPRPGPS